MYFNQKWYSHLKKKKKRIRGMFRWGTFRTIIHPQRTVTTPFVAPGIGAVSPAA